MRLLLTAFAVCALTFPVATSEAPDVSAAGAPLEECQQAIPPGGGAPQFPAMPLESGLASPNPWNLASADGSIQQCFGSSGLRTRIDISNLTYRNPAFGLAGFAEAAYGYGGSDEPECVTSGCATAPFPESAATFSSQGFTAESAFALGVPNPPRTVDVAYDIWLERHPSPGTGPQAGDIEVMIDPYFPGGGPCAGASNTSRWTVDASVNGQATATTWKVCPSAGGTAASLVPFVLADPHQSRSADLGLPIASFLEKAVSSAGMESLGAFTIMGVEFGAEYDGSPGLQWHWNLEKLDLQSQTTTVRIVG